MKKLISKIEKLNLSVKKELILLTAGILAFLVASVVAAIILKNALFLLFGAGFAVVFAIFFISRYDFKLDKISNDNLLEFADLFSFFRIYIKNGYNVYNALKEITNFASNNLRELLSKLIEEIDNDKSVQPFINFARNFNEIIIEEMMISIYQMVDDGEQSNYLVQFEFIFDKFSETLKEKNLHKKESRLSSLCSAPLIGSCFLIIVITIGVIGIIGDVANGL